MKSVSGFELVDMAVWKRKRHFELFRSAGYPFIGMTVNLEVGSLLELCWETGRSFFSSLLFVLCRAVNSLENFRYRIVDGAVVVCERVEPSYTILDRTEELIYFADVAIADDYATFAGNVAAAGKRALAEKYLENGRFDVFYVSSMPWLCFTDLLQPVSPAADDSIPRFAWGRYFHHGSSMLMPFSVLGHHGLFDGWHVHLLIQRIETLIRRDPYGV